MTYTLAFLVLATWPVGHLLALSTIIFAAQFVPRCAPSVLQVRSEVDQVLRVEYQTWAQGRWDNCLDGEFHLTDPRFLFWAAQRAFNSAVLFLLIVRAHFGSFPITILKILLHSCSPICLCRLFLAYFRLSRVYFQEETYFSHFLRITFQVIHIRSFFLLIPHRSRSLQLWNIKSKCEMVVNIWNLMF